MLFRRRERLSLLERLRVSVWPRVGWRRSAMYYRHRTLRLSGTPYAIAMGAGAGTFASFTPFIGFHFLLALGVSWILRGNLIAAAIGTAIGNPLTFPFIWAATYQVGAAMMGRAMRSAPERLDRDLANRSLGDILPLIEPMVLGAIPLGLAAGATAYFLVFKMVKAYQLRRSDRFAAKRRVMGDAAAPNTTSLAEKEKT